MGKEISTVPHMARISKLYITRFMRGKEYPYDAFISHAVEDKIGVANELCERLTDAGLNIWYSGRELTIGKDLHGAIQKGLEASQYGVIVFSPTYIIKPNTLKELLFFQKRGNDFILPVLYQITIPELATCIPDAVGRFALTVGPDNLDHIVKSIVEKIRGVSPHPPPPPPIPWKLILKIAACLLLLLCGAFGIVTLNNLGPPSTVVETAVHERIEAMQQSVENVVRLERAAGASAAVAGDVKSLYTLFNSLQNSYRNGYELDNGREKIKAQYRVRDALEMDVAALSPSNNYGFTSPHIYLFVQRERGAPVQARCTYVNTQPVSYSIDEQHRVDDEYHVTVSYANNLRSITVTLLFPSKPSDLRYNNRMLEGHQPKEIYIFTHSAKGWVLKDVRASED